MKTSFATKDEILEQIISDDFENLISKLELFVYNRIRGMNLSIEAIDIVYDVIVSILEEDEGRNWNKDKYTTFERFIFSAVKSHINNTYKTNLNRLESSNGFSYNYQSDQIKETISSELDLESAKQQGLDILRSEGGDTEEEFIFECWCDGLFKPQDIADFLEVAVSSINNAVRRLERKMPLIQERLKTFPKWKKIA